MHLTVQIFTDGPDAAGLEEVITSWHTSWNEHYSSYASLQFLFQQDLKVSQNRVALPPGLKYLETIRNPDIYFAEQSTGIDLGGIEITDHSPDGFPGENAKFCTVGPLERHR